MKFTENTPLSALTVGDLYEILAAAPRVRTLQPDYARGLKGLADTLGVSVSTAKRIKASGLLAPAISQVGGVILTDTRQALELWSRLSHPQTRLNR